MRILYALSAFLAPTLFAELIPAAKLPPTGGWTPNVLNGVGVVGGIPARPTVTIDITQSPYTADPTGATDSTATIQAAIDACTAGGVVYAPAGIYKIGSLTINIFTRTGGITFRGAGSGIAGGATTIIIPQAASVIALGTDISWPQTGAITVAKAGLTKGSTSITLSDATDFAAGQNVRIYFPPNGSIPTVSTSRYQNTYNQTFYVVAKSGNVLTITPAVTDDYSGLATDPSIDTGSYGTASDYGFEDFVIDGSASDVVVNPIYWRGGVRNTWMKNVKIIPNSTYTTYAMQVVSSTNWEIRDSVIDPGGSGTSHSGLLIDGCSGWLVENNTIKDNFPCIEVNYSCTNGIIAYNYFPSAISAYAIDVNHGPTNQRILLEGNITPAILDDAYFGGTVHGVYYRNWITGLNGFGGSQTYTMAINRFAREWVCIGNILLCAPQGQWGGAYSNRGLVTGQPFGGGGVGTASLTGTGGASPWGDWDVGTGQPKAWNVQLTTRTDDLHGVITISNGTIATDFETQVAASRSGARQRSGLGGGFPAFGARSGNTWTVDLSYGGGTLPALNSFNDVTPGTNGFQEVDLDVAATVTLKYNYSWYDLTATPSLGGDTLSDSLFRSSKPSYFGTITWPPLDPASPPATYDSTTVAALIPAAWRYINGNEGYLTATPGTSRHAPRPSLLLLRR